MKGIRVLATLATAALLGGCAYLPLLTQMAEQSAPVAGESGTVTIPQEEYDRYRQLDGVLDVIDVAKEYYYKDVDTAKLIESATSGALLGLEDPYTFYYTPEDYKTLWEDDEGEYAGVGLQISTSYATGICTISRVFENSPAADAGVHRGDILYQVDDLMVNANTINEAVDIMRGTPGTQVKVSFLRGEETLTFDLTRAQVQVNRVSSMMLSDRIGYIYLYEFAGDSEEKFKEELDQLLAKGAKGLIIDLRDNPGGWVNAAQSIGDLFLDKGVLCYVQYRDGSRETYETKDGKVDLPITILLNENSASASEILSGALRDRAGAKLVGVTSYGKGIMQSVLPLKNGAGMQITVAEYYTPGEHKVHHIGLEPDVEVKLAEGDNGMHELGDLTDAQLAKALEVAEEQLKK